MKKLGVAILGTGAIAGVHVDGFGLFDDRCEVRALCDLFVDKAERLARDKKIAADAYKEYQDVLKRDDIDIISICLPPGVHAEVAVAALKAGKHVLVEKPMASSLEECDAMIAAAEASGALLSVVSQNRFKTPMMRVKKMLDEQAAGKVLHTVVNSLWWRGQNYYDIWWRGTWEKECGGCTTSHAVHHLDLMQWMIGMPESVTALIANVGHDNSECEDIAIAIMQYPGMLAQMTASIVTHDEEQELIFQGQKGRLSIPWKTAASKALENGFPEPDAAGRDALQARYDALPEMKREGHPAQIENFLDAIAGKASLLIDGKEGRKTIELIMAIYKSFCGKEPVKLPIAKDDAFYRKDTMIAAMPRFHQKTKSVDNFATAAITLGRDVGK